MPVPLAPAWKTRADRGQLLAPVMRGGVMLVEGVAVREAVLEYVLPSGEIWRELVPTQTIMDSAGGIAHLPVTLQHPDEDVTPENTGELAVGNVEGDVRVEDGGFTRVHIAVRTKAGQDAVRGGINELSLKYDALVDPTAGVHPQYGPYDGVQVERTRYNHLALVDQARVGPDARIRADGVSRTVFRADAGGTSGQAPANSNKAGTPASGARMNVSYVRLLAMLGVTRRVDSDEAAIGAIEAAVQARLDAEEEMAAEVAAAEEEAVGEKDRLQGAFDALQAAFDALKAECDGLKADKAADADKADRAALLPLASALKVDAAGHAKTKDLRRALATAHLGGKLRADASDAYVDAMVDIAISALTSKEDGRKRGNAAWVPPESDHQDALDQSGHQDGAPRLTPSQRVAKRNAERTAARGGAA